MLFLNFLHQISIAADSRTFPSIFFMAACWVPSEKKMQKCKGQSVSAEVDLKTKQNFETSGGYSQSLLEEGRRFATAFSAEVRHHNEK